VASQTATLVTTQR